MDAITEITKDCLNAIIQLRGIDEVVARPDALHRRMRGFIDEMMQKASEEGLSKRDAADVQYAIVSLADEVASAKPDPVGRYWMDNLLQLQYFGENIAGDEFFRRLQAVRGDRRRRDVLRVYYLCLLLGFQGQYGVRGGQAELIALIEAVGRDLAAQLDAPAVLSPRGDRPDEAVAKPAGKSPLLIAAAVAVLVAVGGFLGLRLSLNAQVNQVVEKLSLQDGAGRP